MGNELWSYILTIVGVTGFLFVGRKVWWAWYINLACQALWVAYALITEQYGFIFAAAVYTVAFGKNAWEWTREHFKKPQNQEELFLKFQTDGTVTPNDVRRTMGLKQPEIDPNGHPGIAYGVEVEYEDPKKSYVPVTDGVHPSHEILNPTYSLDGQVCARCGFHEDSTVQRVILERKCMGYRPDGRRSIFQSP